MNLVKAKVESIERRGGGATSLGAFFQGRGVNPFYVASVTYNESLYKVRSTFPGKVGQYVRFDIDSTPDANGYYLEMGFYDSAEE